MDREWETLVSSWVYLPDLASRLGVTDKLVRSWIKDGRLIAFRVGENNALAVPEDFIAQGDGGEYILTPLRGSLTQLADSGYDALETLRWLYTHEDSLDATPIAALRSGRVATVRRAAQSLAF